jgi:glycosyltransferase involved in cell wall biosynthesis
MLLSVIIPAYNEEKIIADTIQHIRLAVRENLSGPGSWELIVCDNNSDDRTAEIAAQAGAQVVSEPFNQIARARNAGSEAARGEWLLFIDADSYPQAGTIADLLGLVRSGLYIGCGSTIRVDGGPYWYRWNLQGNNLSMRLFKTCIGLFVASEAAAFRAIAGFNTDLYAFEDMDFVNRLKAYGRPRGKKFGVLHRHPVTTSGRKGDLYDRGTMTKSSVVGLWYLLTKRKIDGAGRLPLWYDGRR